MKKLLLLLSLLLATYAWGEELIKNKVMYCTTNDSIGFDYDGNTRTWKRTNFEPLKYTVKINQQKDRNVYGKINTEAVLIYHVPKQPMLDGYKETYSCKKSPLDKNAYYCNKSDNVFSINLKTGNFVKSESAGHVVEYRPGYYDSISTSYGRCTGF